MKKFLTALILFTLLAAPVVAQQGPSEGVGSQNAGVTQVPQQQGGQEDAGKCDMVSSRVNLVTQRYNANQERYMNSYQNMVQNVEKTMLKLEANGYDVAELRSNLVQANVMLQNASRYYNEFQNRLNETKQMVCGESQGQYAQTLTQSREQLQLCRQEMLSLRNFFQNTIRQDLIDLRDQIAE